MFNIIFCPKFLILFEKSYYKVQFDELQLSNIKD